MLTHSRATMLLRFVKYFQLVEDRSLRSCLPAFNDENEGNERSDGILLLKDLATSNLWSH